MPKQKTHSASKKRFRVTGSGKPVRTRGHAKHKASQKTMKQKRDLRGTTIVDRNDAAKIKRALPYAKKNRK